MRMMNDPDDPDDPDDHDDHDGPDNPDDLMGLSHTGKVSAVQSTK